jgi:hypothetical protein
VLESRLATGWYWLSAPRYALKPARTGSKPMELKL